ncbi:MmcB family DNA repair protein [Flaviflagellibacter deserti]|uniref:MmcB family DNA repair protein n=1 Tax=Flaviflagellibacter deserti TaxID=2267266 RepID=A0ABV9Z6K3_9HYPH
MEQNEILSGLAPGDRLRPDGRQSPAASDIARGTMRLMRSLGLACVPELPLASGRRADLVAVCPRGRIWIVEIKSCLADYQADHKWEDYRAHCDRLYFAVDPRFPRDILPEEAGLILADRYGAQVLREPEEHPLAGATRRMMALHLAHTTAMRFHALCDPEMDRELM